MSEQNAMAFINKVSGDAALQASVRALPGEVAALVKFATGAGYAFTADEWKAVAATAFSGELDQDSLDKVAGGGGAAGPVHLDGPGGGCNSRPIFTTFMQFK